MTNNRKIIDKKFIAGLLSGAILFGIFFGCSNRKKKDKDLYIYTENAFEQTMEPTIETESTTTREATTTTTEETVNPYWAWDGEKKPNKPKTTTATTTEESVNPNWAWDGETKSKKTNTPTPTPKPNATNTPTPKPKATNTPTPKPTTATTTEETVDPNWAFEGDSYQKYLKIIDTYNKINDEINNFSFDKAKNNAIKYSKELIDFIFYGGTMNGITFAELKDDAKKEIYEKLQKLDSKIMEYVPDYKEKIGEKYKKVKDFAKTKYEDAKEIMSGKVEINVNVQKGNAKNKSLVLKK